MLPDLPAWPTQMVGAQQRVGVTVARVTRYTSRSASDGDEPVLQSVRAELIGLLTDSARVMGPAEMAAALLASRGSIRTGEQLQRALAWAVVRSAIDVDSIMGTRNHDC